MCNVWAVFKTMKANSVSCVHLLGVAVRIVVDIYTWESIYQATVYQSPYDDLDPKDTENVK